MSASYSTSPMAIVLPELLPSNLKVMAEPFAMTPDSAVSNIAAVAADAKRTDDRFNRKADTTKNSRLTRSLLTKEAGIAYNAATLLSYFGARSQNFSPLL